jgi:GNAT superfamily N-acetyltransferase
MEEKMPVPNIRTFAPHEWATYKDLRLRALADSPDAFGGTHAESQARSDDVWIDRLSEGASSGLDLPLVAEVDGIPAGLAWGRIDRSNPEVANLYQMWVDPDYRCLGAGRLLVEAVITWAKSLNTSFVELGVTCGNAPATRLYTRAGFEPTGKVLPLRPGSELSIQLMRLKLN